MMPIPSLWTHYPEAEGGHTAGDDHGQERRAGRWFGLKFSYPGVSTHGSTPAGTGVTFLTGRHQCHLQSEVSFWSTLGRSSRGKIPLLNNSLLAIVKKHKVGGMGGIFIPNVRSTFARQGKVQCCTWSHMTPVLSLLCKSGKCKYPQPAELHSGHPSLTPTHMGTQKTKESTSEGVQAKSVWGQASRSCKASRSEVTLNKP